MKEIRQMKEKSIAKQEIEEIQKENIEAAAIKIQKIWRGYRIRCWIRKRRLDEMLLIGLTFFYIFFCSNCYYYYY